MKPVIKCVLIGDNCADKTSLLKSFVDKAEKFNGKIPDNKEWVFDHYHVVMTVGGKSYALSLYDTPEEFDKLRPLSFPYTDVFLVCYSVVHPASFRHVKEKYVREINYHLPFTPYVLVGTQTDRRDDPKTLSTLERNNQRPVTKEEGQQLAQELGAAAYFECSAITWIGVSAVFTEASRIAIQENPKLLEHGKDKKCALM